VVLSPVWVRGGTSLSPQITRPTLRPVLLALSHIKGPDVPTPQSAGRAHRKGMR
jgi:hypothetical protein